MIISYVVNDGDSLENIAMRILGDANLWKDIARFNRLHSPYISNDILDYYGNPSAKGKALSSTYHPQDSTHHFLLSPAPQETEIDTDGIFILGQYGLNGVFNYDTLKIKEYDEKTGEITTSTSPSLPLTVNSVWFAYPSEIPTKTARTGDLLYIQDGEDTPIRASQKFYDPLGTDILLDEQGRMQWTNQTVATGYLYISNINATVPLVLPAGTFFSHNLSGQNYQSTKSISITPSTPNILVPVSSVESGLLGSAGKGSVFTLVGSSTSPSVAVALNRASIVADTLLEAPYRPADVSLIRGAANVRQALINRLGTQVGQLVYHPNYGNLAFGEIGMPDADSERALVEAYSISCMQNESRISEILGGNSYRDSDAIHVSANVRVRDTGQRLTIDDVELRFLNTDNSQVVGR